MSARHNDLRDCGSAYDCRERLPELSSWMDDDTLKELTIWRGTRFAAGEAYFDLDNPARGIFVATGDEAQPTHYAFVARSEVSETAWIQLQTWGQPVSESQGEALQRLEDDASPAGSQSAAGDARPRPTENPDEGRRMRGVVARVTPERGFGFIVGDDDAEYFFHRGALQAVRFEGLAPGVEADVHGRHRSRRPSGRGPARGQRAPRRRCPARRGQRHPAAREGDWPVAPRGAAENGALGQAGNRNANVGLGASAEPPSFT